MKIQPISFPMPKLKAQEEPKKPIATVQGFKHLAVKIGKGWLA